MAVFTGLRASELRGLRWENVDFDARGRHVLERADRYNQIGPPKSSRGREDGAANADVANTLKAWKLEIGREGARVRHAQGHDP